MNQYTDKQNITIKDQFTKYSQIPPKIYTIRWMQNEVKIINNPNTSYKKNKVVFPVRIYNKNNIDYKATTIMLMAAILWYSGSRRNEQTLGYTSAMATRSGVCARNGSLEKATMLLLAAADRE